MRILGDLNKKYINREVENMKYILIPKWSDSASIDKTYMNRL